MKQVISSFIFCLFIQTLFAQVPNSSVETSQNMVIANSGLRMRAAPSLKSKKILTIPFGKTVKILNNQSYGLLLEDGTTNTNEGVKDTIDFVGDWVKVAYKGKTGYVCNAYLYYSNKTEQATSKEKGGVNEDIALLITDGNCFSNIYSNKEWNWYGLAFNKNKKGFEVEPVTVNYKASYADGPQYYMLMTYTKEGTDARFLIGTKKSLKTKFIPDVTTVGYLEYEQNFTNEVILAKQGLKIKQLNDDQNSMQLSLERDGKEQILTPDPKRSHHYAIEVDWVGDLDGDGQLDYIISFGEESVESTLFLSSKAEGDQLVKPVAIWYSGYCC